MTTINRKQSKYEELELIKAALSDKARRLHADLAETEDALRAVALAINVWKNNGTVAASKKELSPRLRQFRGLTQVEALIKIAKDGGTNRFKLREAKKILLEAGLVKSKKNAGTILFTAIQRSERFKRVAPGEYELLPVPDQMINQVMRGQKPAQVVGRFLRSA